MKKLLILAIAFLGMALGISAQNRSINFIEDKNPEQIKEMAKQENKLIFMDFCASWCKPCKRMDKEVYINDSVADFFNSHFINVKIDVEKKEWKDLVDKYKIYLLPTLLLVSFDDKVENVEYRFRTPGEFIQLGLDALDPKKKFSQLVFESYDSTQSGPVICTVSFLGTAGDHNNELMPGSVEFLDDVYELMKKDTSMTISIVGYANDYKRLVIKEYLERVSGEWAETVYQYLISKGISGSRMSKAIDIRYNEIKVDRKKSGSELAEKQKYMGVEIREVEIVRK